ncbi:MAG: His-Xaa-Ser system radical SAM maturase HxsB [Rhodospirillales bacterium]|nr:MAG: His-Xaa-Ser system radical SAM maturase HxsB [Rhodospirillales bacterium]
MARFKPAESFESAGVSGYKLLPFRFTRLYEDRYVASNLVGEYLVLDRATIEGLVRGRLPAGTSTYRDLASRHFLVDADSSVGEDLLALKARTRLLGLAEFTGLHIFVVTLRCEHSCPYCQVSRRSADVDAFDMTAETASKALDLVFRSPSSRLKIEFQGGEPLLNFALIERVVEAAESRAAAEGGRPVEFVIATNLALVTDGMLEFAREHRILISTSLDGPRDLHDRNRPRPGHDSHARAVSGIERARAALGHDRVSALMTTTKESLARPEEIVDEYVRLGFDSIFLRPLSPYGFAVKTKSYAGYDVDAWLDFYVRGLTHILELNRRGHRLVESYAAIVLSKMLTPFETGYVDLRSPAGIGIGAVVYNYDGSVYASDEARMLAEMGDTTFAIGNVHTDRFEDIFLSDRLLDPLEASTALSVPMCADCAFEPYCGADPVFHHATQGDFVGRKPTSAFCRRNMAVFRHLISTMEADPEARRIFRAWAARG